VSKQAIIFPKTTRIQTSIITLFSSDLTLQVGM